MLHQLKQFRLQITIIILSIFCIAPYIYSFFFTTTSLPQTARNEVQQDKFKDTVCNIQWWISCHYGTHRTFYDVLSIPFNATDDEIKRGWQIQIATVEKKSSDSSLQPGEHRQLSYFSAIAKLLDDEGKRKLYNLEFFALMELWKSYQDPKSDAPKNIADVAKALKNEVRTVKDAEGRLAAYCRAYGWNRECPSKDDFV